MDLKISYAKYFLILLQTTVLCTYSLWNETKYLKYRILQVSSIQKAAGMSAPNDSDKAETLEVVFNKSFCPIQN